MADSRSQYTPFVTGHIAAWVRCHRKLVLLFWLIAAVVLIGACFSVGANEDLEETLPGESGEALKLLQDRFDFGEGGTLTETIVFSHPTLTVDDPEYQAVVQGLLSGLRDLRSTDGGPVGGTDVVSNYRLFSKTLSHYDIGAPREASPLVSAGDSRGDVTFAQVEYSQEIDELGDDVGEATRLVAEAAEASGFRILIGGGATLNEQLNEIIEEDFNNASLLNLPLTLIILLIALGGILAAGVPVALAYAGVAMAAGVVALVSNLVPMFDAWIQIVLLMGLAAGIDYTLFLFTRFRSEREEGRPSAEAAAAANHTAGKAVMIAGATTMLALFGLFIIGNVVFNSIEVAAVLTIFMVLLMALTLTPALLGDGLSRLNIPKIGRRFNVAQAGLLNPVARGIVRTSVRWPWIVAPLSVAVMLALTYPMLTLNLGFNGARAFHDDIEAKAAILALEDNFTIGLLAPAVVVVDPGKGNNIFAADVQSRVDRLIELVLQENQRAEAAGEHIPFVEPINTNVNRSGDLETIEIPLNADTGDQEALDAVALLRDELIPEAFPGDSTRGLVTGATGANVDFKDEMLARTPYVVIFVVLTAFVVLVVLYRSLLVPLITVFLNLLAVGAGYGVLVLVFQEGWALEGLLSFEATGIIESWLPLFVFTVMFGISMDYLNFAITRVEELFRRGYSIQDAIVEGVGNSFGIVFSAAAIMIAVAAVFALMRFLAIQQLGFALVLAVLFDTTVILLVLLPALMAVAGKYLWYFPSWLRWIPGGRNLVEPPGPSAASPTGELRPIPGD